MRKVLFLVSGVLFAVLVFLTLAYLHVPLGEPKLRLELYPSPPWQVRAGDSLELAIGVANDGWLLAWAKDVRITVSMPQGFTVSMPSGYTNTRTGMNECELRFFTLHGGDGLDNGLTIVVPNDILPGNYTITFKLYGENVPEKTFTPQLEVLAT